MRPWSQGKVVWLADVLRRQLGRHIPGCRLPSQADLSRRFDVPLRAVRTTLALLEQEGIVECHPSGGVFVTERAAAAASPIRQVFTFCFDYDHPALIQQEILLGIDRQCARHRLALRPLRTNVETLQADSLAELCGGVPTSAGWLFLYCTPPESCILAWQIQGISFVRIDQSNLTGRGCTVSCDSRVALYQVTERLVLLGHRRIAYLGPVSDINWTPACRLEGFKLAHAR
ncbi:MAG: GntR family transcriptional regulator, partial [Phycisphaerae bacterium]|nr:GntR family transcriptional regulator [Phycisphaerae bacterium]